MADVDPFVVQWPQKWMIDEEIRPVIQYLDRFLHDLRERTGGGNDAIEDLENESSADTSRSQSSTQFQLESIEQIADLIPPDSTEYKQFYSVAKSENYTAVSFDFVEATNGATITLDSNAELDDEIMIANGDGSTIKIIGDSIKFNKLDSQINMRRQGTSYHFHRFHGYWRVR